SINNSGKVVGVYIDANGVTHGYLATPKHGDSGSSNSAPLRNAFGSSASTLPDPLPPAHGMGTSPGSTPAAQGKPTLLDVPGIDQVFAEGRWSTAPWGFHPSRSGLEGLPLDWLHDELADHVAGTR